MSSFVRLGPLLQLTALVGTMLALSGCALTRSAGRPVQALAFRNQAERASCLVVFLPGILDFPDAFQERGWSGLLAEHGSECDAVAVDLHLRYYLVDGDELPEVIVEDILVPAQARGYESIWLVGISIGGLGAAMIARDHPELVDGLMLFSPFFGNPGLVDEVRRAGGLAAWDPGVLPEHLTSDNFPRIAWGWLKRYVDEPEGMPPLYLGFAEDDWIAPGNELLAAVLPPERVMSAAGAHGWSTWTPMFRELLDRADITRSR